MLIQLEITAYFGKINLYQAGVPSFSCTAGEGLSVDGVEKMGSAIGADIKPLIPGHRYTQT